MINILTCLSTLNSTLVEQNSTPLKLVMYQGLFGLAQCFFFYRIKFMLNEMIGTGKYFLKHSLQTVFSKDNSIAKILI